MGVKKAQTSKLGSWVNSVTIDTIMNVFSALKADINLSVTPEDNFLKPI